MFYGQYFEWHLLGAVRSGIEPKFSEKLNGEDRKAKVQLDELILKAKMIMAISGINIPSGEKQLRLETDTLEGHLDLVTNDFQNPGAKAIYDVKWTATKFDDRWNGWADPENDPNVKLQALQYIKLYKDVRGDWVPFYYLIFGKSGWVRYIKVVATENGIKSHVLTLENATGILAEMANTGFAAKPEFNKCQSCFFASECDKKSLLPAVEKIFF